MVDQQFAAHDLSSRALGSTGLRISKNRIIDSHNRTINLHGLNISGSSKLPSSPNGLSHIHEGFYETHRTVSFVNRPFPLSEAPLHFSRLRAWGLPLIRLLVTWEALSHSGPDIDDVDMDYVEYLVSLVKLMNEYGLKCFICAHQDVWSRFSGGSGAPAWTFEKAGMDIQTLMQTGAAYIHCVDEKNKSSSSSTSSHSKSQSKKEVSGAFLWPSGYQKLAASTMATLFWAGDALAPKLTFGENGIQTLLQNSYIDAFGILADKLEGLDACLGFEPMNEPHRGLVNLHDFHSWNYDTDLHIGHYPSFIQSLALGSGFKQQVEFYVKSWPFPTRVSHKSIIDPKGKECWLEEEGCIWRKHGVWEWDESKNEPVVLQYDYFEKDHRTGERLEWYRDCYGPFLKKFDERCNKGKGWMFVEPIPNEFIPPWIPVKPFEASNQAEQYRDAALGQTYATKTLIDIQRPGGEEGGGGFVYAPHFYDLNVLFGKVHSWMSVNVQGLSRGMFLPKALYFGSTGLKKNYLAQLRRIKELAYASLGRVPIIIGEVGIPFDINSRYAYRTGDYSKQHELLDALIGAMEKLGLGFTLWNYNPDNRVEFGDGWNYEDFSIVNGDKNGEEVKPDFRNDDYEQDELYQGGRGLEVIIRPYAVKVAGVQIDSEFDVKRLFFEMKWRNHLRSGQKWNEQREESEVERTTEIFLPAYHYKNKRFSITTTDCETRFNAELQTLYVTHRDTRMGVEHKLKIELQDPEGWRRERIRRKRELVKPEDWIGRVGRLVVTEGMETWWDGMSAGQVRSMVIIGMVVIVGIWFADRHMKMYMEKRSDL